MVLLFSFYDYCYALFLGFRHTSRIPATKLQLQGSLDAVDTTASNASAAGVRPFVVIVILR